MVDIFRSLGRSLGFEGSNAAGRAAEQRREFNQKAIDELRERFGLNQELLDPFLQAGLTGFQQFTDVSTPEGLDAQLGRIFETDTFGNLVDERRRAVEGQLSAGGFTRSGTALQEIANVPTELGLTLENLLAGRSGAIGDVGFQTATNLSNQGLDITQTIAKLLQDSGIASAGGILGDAQARAGQDENLFRTVTGAVRGGIIGGQRGVGGLTSAFF